ncbi:MAG: hypothetical protein R3D32_14925 [Nitratireductor sp.]
MTNLRYLILLMLVYGVIWLGVTGILLVVPVLLPPLLHILIGSPLRALVTMFPAAAVCLYLRRQTGQKKRLIGTALAALVAIGQTLWAVLEFGQIVPGDYQGLAVLTLGSLSGPVPFMGLTIMGCISRLQHPVTRWIGFATLAMVAIVGVSLKETTDVQDVSFEIFLIALMLSFVLALSGLLASAVLGTRNVAL